MTRISPYNDAMKLLPASGALLLLLVSGCAEQAKPEARVVALRRSHVTIEVKAKPGCVVDPSGEQHLVNDEGVARFEVDVKGYFEFQDGKGVREIDLSVACSRYVVSKKRHYIKVALPLDTSAIKRLPESGMAFTGSSTKPGGKAVATFAGPPILKFGADDSGHALIPVAAPGASAISLAAAELSVDPVSGSATVAVDLAPIALRLAKASGGEVPLAASYTIDGKPQAFELALSLSEAQATSVLDGWIKGGAPKMALPPKPANAILWRRASKITSLRKGGPAFVQIGDASMLGSKYLATEETTKKRIRGCGYIAHIGIKRVVVVREIATGKEVARRSFAYRGRAKCPIMTSSNQPDQFFFAKHSAVQSWLERELKRLGG